MTPRFSHRLEAGELLAKKLQRYASSPGVIVLGLPRGGVPVAAAVAESLNVPLDVICVRKLGVPGHEELAMGAISAGGTQVLNAEIIRTLRISPDTVAQVAAREAIELRRRELAYRENRAPPVIEDQTVILIDDGIATGATTRAALADIRQRRAGRTVVAAPVIARDSYRTLLREADAVTALIVSDHLVSIGEWYDDFAQTSDEEVVSTLRRNRPDSEGNFLPN